MRFKYTCAAALLLALPVFALAQDSDSFKGSACAKSGDCIELADIIRDFSKRTGKKFIVDPRVRAMGGVTGVDVNKITYEQLIALFTVHYFVAVPQGDVTIVIPDANARQQATPVYFDTNFKALDDEWVTLLLSGKNMGEAARLGRSSGYYARQIRNHVRGVRHDADRSPRHGR